MRRFEPRLPLGELFEATVRFCRDIDPRYIELERQAGIWRLRDTSFSGNVLRR